MLTTAPRDYGVANPAEAKLMSGREFLEAIVDGRLPAPPIARTLSFLLTEIGDGFAAFEGDPGEHLLNPLGLVHGGWALTLIDSATGCAAQTILPAGVSYTTIETKANFDRPITEGFRAGARGGAGRQPRPAHHLVRRADRRRPGAHTGPRRLDADGVGGRQPCSCSVGFGPRGAQRARVIGTGKRTPRIFSIYFLAKIRICAIVAFSPAAPCGATRGEREFFDFFRPKPLKSPDSDE